jgi:nucleoside-diphosphate-sugar epimerase
MKKQTILVTGNLGYIGSTMVPMLTESGYDVIGYDIGYYEGCELVPQRQKPIWQIKKDLRDVEAEDLSGVDCVIHLAGLSNDPLGEFDPSLTEAINHMATLKLAECAKKAGVKRFLYTSSQSIYGVSDTSKEVDEEGQKNPVTIYAKTKWQSECDLRALCDGNFTIAYLRPATAYGASPDLRTDIVLNQFVAYAYVNKRIQIKSDGTPWRPMSHIRDVAAAFIACLEAPAELIANQSFNVGTSDNNYTVRQLAEAAQKCVEGTEMTFTGEHTDPRSYRVSSQKILTILKDYYKPRWNILAGADELMRFYRQVGFDQALFGGEKTVRLKCLMKRIQDGTLDANLRAI